MGNVGVAVFFLALLHLATLSVSAERYTNNAGAKFSKLTGKKLYNAANSASRQNDAALTPVRIEKLEPVLRPDATRLRLYYGPFSVLGQSETRAAKSKGMDPNSVVVERSITGFCKNCTVFYGKADTYYLNGTRAGISSGLYNHHIVVLDTVKRIMPWWLCEGQTGLGKGQSSGFMVTGVDEAANMFTTPDGKFQSGYWIGLNQTSFFMQAELINYREKNITVYATTEVEYVEGKIDGYADASMSLASVTGCNSPDYHPPHGQAQFNSTNNRVRMPRDGYIINAKGHMHDGGVNILLSLNDKVICDSRAIYGGDGSETVAPNGKPWETIREMTQCTEPIPVKAGDVVSIKAVYDTSLHPLRQSADGHGGEMDEMGVFFINFAAASH